MMSSRANLKAPLLLSLKWGEGGQIFHLFWPRLYVDIGDNKKTWFYFMTTIIAMDDISLSLSLSFRYGLFLCVVLGRATLVVIILKKR